MKYKALSGNEHLKSVRNRTAGAVSHRLPHGAYTYVSAGRGKAKNNGHPGRNGINAYTQPDGKRAAGKLHLKKLKIRYLGILILL